MMAGLRIEKLPRDHAVDAFDCGSEDLKRFLIRFAFPNQQARASPTYLGLPQEVAFRSLSSVRAGQGPAPDRRQLSIKGQAGHAIDAKLPKTCGRARRGGSGLWRSPRA